MKIKRIITLSLVTPATCLFLLCANSTALASFSGTTTGIFVDPSPSTATVTGVGTSFFTFGSGVSTPSCSLQYTSTAFQDIPVETTFKVGTLTYYNGSIYSGTEANSVALSLALNFTAPSGVSQNFTYGLQLISTLNTDDPISSADYVVLSSFPDVRFISEGVSYTLSLQFTDLQGGGFIQSGNQLHVLENDQATAVLTGKITTAVAPATTAVPEPSTYITGICILSMVGLNYWRKRK